MRNVNLCYDKIYLILEFITRHYSKEEPML